MTKLLYQRILVVLLALIVVFGGWFAADWQLRRAEAAANWTDQKQVLTPATAGRTAGQWRQTGLWRQM